VSDRRHLGDAARENPGHVTTFFNQKLDAVTGSQPCCLCNEFLVSAHIYENQGDIFAAIMDNCRPVDLWSRFFDRISNYQVGRIGIQVVSLPRRNYGLTGMEGRQFSLWGVF